MKILHAVRRKVTQKGGSLMCRIPVCMANAMRLKKDDYVLWIMTMDDPTKVYIRKATEDEEVIHDKVELAAHADGYDDDLDYMLEREEVLRELYPTLFGIEVPAKALQDISQ